MNVGIINYGSSNIVSVFNWVSRQENIGTIKLIDENTDNFLNSDLIIIPGVGSFKQLSIKLLKSDLLLNLESQKKRGTIIVGICLGAQIMLNGSEEDNCLNQGFGWFDGSTKRISNISQPIVGWFKSETNNHSPFKLDNYYYHNHNYSMHLKNKKEILSTTANGLITSAIYKENLIGLQFHPEKSQKEGKNVWREITNLMK